MLVGWVAEKILGFFFLLIEHHGITSLDSTATGLRDNVTDDLTTTDSFYNQHANTLATTFYNDTVIDIDTLGITHIDLSEIPLKIHCGDARTTGPYVEQEALLES